MKINYLRIKIVFRLIIQGTLILNIISCQNLNKTKIGFLIPASIGYRWPTDLNYIEQAAAKYDVSVLSLSAENDENLQVKQATELLKEGIDVLIVVPVNSNTSAAIVRNAHEYHVPVIAYERLIKNSDLDYLVTFDSKKIGESMVDFALENKPEGNYVLLWGDPGDVNAHLLREGQEEALKPYVSSGKISIIYRGFIEDWSQENALYLMKEILLFSDKHVDAVITSYDGIARGVQQAYKELDINEKIILTGQDAELPAIHSILNDEMNYTVYKPIKMIAEKSVELAVKLAQKQKVEDISNYLNNGRKQVPMVLLSPQPVTKNTIRETVIADGFYTEEEVFKTNN